MGALGQAPFSLGPLPPGLQAQLAATQAQMVASQAMAQAHVQQQQGGPTFQRDSGQPQGVKVRLGAFVENADLGSACAACAIYGTQMPHKDNNPAW